MNWSTSVLTTVSSDTEPSITVTFDKAKYMFNAGENSGRAFLQSKRNWRKTRGIFFTDVGSQRTGGLPGKFLDSNSAHLMFSRVVDDLCRRDD